MAKMVYMLEDDRDDRYLTEDMLKELGLDITIRFFSRSTDLMEGLKTDPPSFILVDFNSSPDNGIDVVKKIRAAESTASIPVIILSDTNIPRYRKEAYAAGASSYITKPSNMKGTKEKIGTFFKYWLEVAETG